MDIKEITVNNKNISTIENDYEYIGPDLTINSNKAIYNQDTSYIFGNVSFQPRKRYVKYIKFISTGEI